MSRLTDSQVIELADLHNVMAWHYDPAKVVLFARALLDAALSAPQEASKAEGDCPGCGGLGRVRVLRCEQCDGTGKILASPSKEASKVEPVAVSHEAVEAAAKAMAACFDYPWEHMPERGRNTMRENVLAVFAAAGVR